MAATGTLPRTPVGSRTLPTDGQSAPVPQSPIAPDIHQPFYVTGDLTAQIAFDPVIVLNYSRYPTDVVLGQIADPGIGVDLGSLKNSVCCRAAYTVDICQSDLDPLVFWQVYTYYASHRMSPPSLNLL